MMILNSWPRNRRILPKRSARVVRVARDLLRLLRPSLRTRSNTLGTLFGMKVAFLLMQFTLFVRQTLAGAHRPPSPTLVLDDEPDPILLEPELVKIAQAIRSDSSKSLVPESSDLNGGPEVVAIKMRWRPHPLNVTARSQVWEFQMNRVRMHFVSRRRCQEIESLEIP